MLVWSSEISGKINCLFYLCVLMSFFSGESVSYGWMCELAFLDLVHMMKFSFVIFQPCVAC